LRALAHERRPLPETVRDRRREALVQRTRRHDQLPAVMRLVRDEVREHVADIERQIAP